MEQSAVTIVGGGIYGASLAWHLSRARVRVTLYEKDDLAAGASGGPGNRGVRSSGRPLADLAIAGRAVDMWNTLSDAIQADVGFTRIGSLRLYEEFQTGINAGFVGASARAAVQQANGVETHLLTAGEVLDREPMVTTALMGALYCPRDGIVDQGQATRALAAAAQILGAEIVTNTEIVDLAVHGGLATEIIDHHGRAHRVSGTLMLLCNMEVPALMQKIDLRPFPTWHITPYISLGRPRGTDQKLTSLIAHDSRRVAIKQIANGDFMISGGWPYNPPADGSESSPAAVPELVQGNLAEAAAALPALADFELTALDTSRSDTVSLDGLPIIDMSDAARNVMYGFAWNGHGMAPSIEYTRLIADWITSHNRPAELAPFSAGRF